MADSNIMLAQASPPGSSDFALVASQVPPREDANAFPPFDTQYWAPQIIWLILLFGVLYIAMSKFGLPRVARILDERRGRLDADLGGARTARKKAEDEQAAYEHLLASARERAQTEGQAKHAELAAKSAATRKTLEAQLNDKLAAADQQIAETKTRAMANVSTIARETAAAIAERLLGRSVDAGVVDRAMSDTTKS
jgi:F-type H+-transporting ATPase subunit b